MNHTSTDSAPAPQPVHQGRTVVQAMSRGEQVFTLCVLAVNLAFGAWLTQKADFSAVLPNSAAAPTAIEAPVADDAPLLAMEARR